MPFATYAANGIPDITTDTSRLDDAVSVNRGQTTISAPTLQ